METKELTCIGCPMGCLITVQVDQEKIQSIQGNACPNGDRYVRQEILAPMRILTTTVSLEGSPHQAVLSVKTSAPIPKHQIFVCIHALKKVRVQAPVRVGDLVLKNVADTGVDVIATQNVG